MDKKKVELLAPAGNYTSFLGAINAGADAVYLGGTKFGARAYADNFTEEEICNAIRYAHLFGKKVYLTVNTLIKESEIPELIPYLEPLYLAGLDGVIVQDVGAMLMIRDAFPDLELHISTQMTVTGTYAANMLKEMGAVRIVPARELSLKELKTLKEETGLEIETFIHGAMCYCYSGQCLFSSILGGRSGNRGRCAQPCRLPYQVDGFGKEQYPLSLKDMCSLSFLPDLIEAGIDSFKIEGRMKKPEYAAGVTAIYRKYIDLYYRYGREGYKVSKSDMDKLVSLYIRSGIQDGYYFKHNGKEMVTISSPAYNGSDEKVLEEVRNQFLTSPMKKSVQIKALFKTGKEAELNISCDKTVVKVVGEVVQTAAKQPITIDNIKSSLMKLGNTPFCTTEEDIQVNLSEGAFYSLKALNELRRQGMQALETAICQSHLNRYKQEEYSCETTVETDMHSVTENGKDSMKSKQQLSILVSTMEQLQTVMHGEYMPDVLYIDSQIAEISVELINEIRNHQKPAPAIYVALPYIVRNKDIPYLVSLLPILEEADGVLVRNVESYAWLKDRKYAGKINTDAGVYCFNKKTLAFWQSRVSCCCLPYELNKKEIKNLHFFNNKTEQVVYGHIPLMITANCVAKTTQNCRKGTPKEKETLCLKDRYRKAFPVTTNCNQCYNIIYNSVPLSLHDKVYSGEVLHMIRVQFTTESAKQTRDVLSYFKNLLNGNKTTPPYADYTLGHEKRGVE